MRGNCLIFAIRKWRAEGGYIIVRRSRLATMFPRPWWHPVWLVPHFLHRGWDHRVTQYVPTEDQRRRHLEVGLWRAWLDLWDFDGEITGDDRPAA